MNRKDKHGDSAFYDARKFFTDELRAALEKHQISARPISFDYLVGLMLRHLESKNFFATNADGKLEDNFLVDLYSAYLHATPERQKVILQRLGDVCLFVSGFFSASLDRKLVDIDYYFNMGETAYHQLSVLHGSFRTSHGLFSELSKKFKPFSNALGEMSEKSGVQSNTDLLRLYERWLSTGSDRLRTLLDQHGIKSPFIVDNKIKH